MDSVGQSVGVAVEQQVIDRTEHLTITASFGPRLTLIFVRKILKNI